MRHPRLADIDREIVRRGSFYDFVRLAWPIVERGQVFIDTWHVKALCDHLEACFAGDIKTLLVNVPPGCSKSIITCVFFPVWCWIKNANLRFLCGSFDIDLVLRDSTGSFNLMRSDWFLDRWGDLLTQGAQAMSWLETRAQGWRIGISKRGKGTGHHPDIKIIDDADRPDAVTPISLADTRVWLTQVMGMRQRSPGLKCTISIQQRVHLKDGTGILKELFPAAVHLCLPMEFREKKRCVTYVNGVEFFRDPRTEEKALLVPERFDAAEVTMKRKALGPSGAAAQYDQDPVADGGTIINTDWFRYWKELPRLAEVIISVDCAFKDEASSDYVAIQAWGVSGPNFYLLDQRAEHLDFSATCKAVVMMCLRWPQAIDKLVEDKANGTAVLNVLSGKIPGMLPINPEGGKIARANAVSGLIEAGNVYLPDPSMPGFTWVTDDFLPEVGNFPRDEHDDQVDAMTQALSHLFAKGGSFVQAMEAIEQGMNPATSPDIDSALQMLAARGFAM